MMFVGDKGKILAGFRVENPRLMSGAKAHCRRPPAQERQQRQQREPGQTLRRHAGSGWLPAKADRNRPAVSSMPRPISEAVNLYAVALRTGQRLLTTPATMQITNMPDANKYLAREYRKGFDPESI